MSLKIELEEDCRGIEGLYCHGGYVATLLPRSYRLEVTDQACPGCHGRGKVPTAFGYQVLEMVKHWEGRELP